MAIAIILSLTFSSCIKMVKNSINNEKLQNENFAAEQKKSEITKVSDGSLIIYTPSQEIKLDPSFKIADKQEKVKEAYNKPGKPILFSEIHSVDYLTKSLWTKYDYSKEIIMLYYDKSKQQFIFQTDKTDIKEILDIVPMLIFLALLGVLIYSLFNKSDIKILLPFWLSFLIFCLSLNYLLKVGTETILVTIIVSAITSVFSFGVYGIFMLIFNLIGFKNLPMPKRHAKSAHTVIAYSLVTSLVFLLFTNVNLHYFWLLLFFLSPYLIFWIITAAKLSRTLVLRKIMSRTE